MTGMKLPRFQFRLRTLMIVVTLLAALCGYVAWQASIVRERQEEIRKITDAGGTVGFYDVVTGPLPTEVRTVPILRRWFGDRAVLSVLFKKGATNEERHRIREIFPEAVFVVSHETLFGNDPAIKP